MTPLPVHDSVAFQRRFDNGLRAASLITKLQINIGLVCNLACHHCHVDSSPKRSGSKENMSAETAGRVLEWIATHEQISTVDFTGGSPEMNPNFRNLVQRVRGMGRHVMDRCNPTIIPYVDPNSDPNGDPTTGNTFEWIPQFLADHQVEVVASLPCYVEENVDAQRGRGAYNASVDGLLRLNAVGYGRDERLRLNLVYNPNGPHLPPAQESLTVDYHRELEERFGLVFNELWTIANMPIKRWRRQLERDNELADYMDLLRGAYNPATIEGLMCRDQIHIDSTGRIYDCDFNYALEMPAMLGEELFLWDVTPQQLAERPIATGDHCYGCTAGAGSSCGGSLVETS